MKELLAKYRELKAMEADRDERLQKAKAEYEGAKAHINAVFTGLDEEIQNTRERIRKAMGDNTLLELDDAKVEIADRSTVTITDPERLASWLVERGKGDLVKPLEFKKAEVNKIVFALAAIKEAVPGTRIDTNPVLSITLYGQEIHA